MGIFTYTITMKKIHILICFFLIMNQHLTAQKRISSIEQAEIKSDSKFNEKKSNKESFLDINLFRNYQNSLILHDDEFERKSFSNYNSYGKESKNSTSFSYTYQSQEYERQLGVYLFPSRVYSFINMRFIQPDPKSQHHSDYLYCKSDPINYIDVDGNANKPLILYGENLSGNPAEEAAFNDLKHEVKDAYYCSLRDFATGRVGDVSEWNGKIFIKSHTGTIRGKEILVQESNELSLLKRSEGILNPVSRAEFINTYVVDLDAKALGQHLRRFSEHSGIPLRKVVVEGCEGSYAAEQIAKGYTEVGANIKWGKTLKVKGLKSEHYALIKGKESVERELPSVRPLSRTRFYVKHFMDQDVTRISKIKDGSMKFSRFSGIRPNGKARKYSFMEGEEIDKFVNGRIPRRMKKFYKTFKVSY